MPRWVHTLTAIAWFLAAASVLVAQEAPVANVLRKPSRPANWTLQVNGSAAASLRPEPDGAISVTVAKTSSEAWHVQLFQSRLSLMEGAKYTLRFRAKSDAPRAYKCQVATDVADWHNVSPVFDVPTTTDYRSFSFEFAATRIAPNACRGPQFDLGLIAGTLTLADVALEGPSPAAARLPLPNGFFEFPMQWDDTPGSNAMDVSFLNQKPADRRIVVRNGHFADERTGQRVRFFGTNIGGAQAFPEKEDARTIARRLAKAGVNLVRLHALDNSWSAGTGGSIWDAEKPGHQLSAVQFDKLDYLIAQLKENGIYVNLNLKVVKVLTPADGFPESVRKIPFDFQKRVDIFDRRMIDLQKEYARALLTHRNAYTGLAYSEDPVVMVVEANNENSLVSQWEPALGTRLDTIPEPFLGELAKLWSQWLQRKYGSDADLTAAWSKGTTPPGESVLSPEMQWVPENHENARLAVVPDKATGPHSAPALLADVQAVDGTDWHVQTNLNGLSVTEGDFYTVSFRAKADQPRKMALNLAKDVDDWHNMGLNATADVGTDWRDFAFTFSAHAVAPQHARLTFVLGNQAGKVWLTDVQLAPGARLAGLQPGQSLAKENLPLPTVVTPAQHADWIAFLVDTEKAYADEMRSVVKNELKTQAVFSITQIEYGGIGGMVREHDSDYADAHTYWQHPDFPKEPWSPVDWKIGNTPEVAVFETGSTAGLALNRVAGKPYSVSEYDHPAPSDYVCEMMPTYATFAALQDWDAIYTFAMSDYTLADDFVRIQGYFDQSDHPAKWCLYPTAALIFRQGLIAPAEAQAVLELPAPFWETYEFAHQAWRALSPEGAVGLLSRRVATSDQPLPPGSNPRISETGVPAPTQVRLERAAAGNVYITGAPGAVAFVGYVGGATLSAGGVEIHTDSFGDNFAAITVTATDSQPLAESRRILVTVCGRVENQGMVWNPNRTSVGAQWGRGPTIAEHVPARLTLPVVGAPKVYALDASGNRKKQADAPQAGGRLTLTAKAEDATIVYEVCSDAASTR